MNRPNLIPTIIVDKNNKTTTVHKRAVTDTGSGKKMPSPAATTAKKPSRAALLKRSKAVIENNEDFSNSIRLLSMDYLEGVEAEPLAYVVDLLEQRTPDYSIFQLIGSASDRMHHGDFLEYASMMKNNYYRLSDIVKSPDPPSTVASGIIRGCQSLRIEYPEITPEQGEAIMDAVAAIYHATGNNDEYPLDLMWVSRDRTIGDQSMFVLNSKELRIHIMEKPEDSSRVSELIHHNPNLRVAELMHLLKNPNTSTSLADGAL
jgi:hypothetical protein